MKLKRLLDERISMLMAIGTPVKSSTYGLGQPALESNMMHRNMVAKMPADPRNQVRVRSVTEQTESKHGASRAPSIRSWLGLGRLFDRLEAWSWERETREREAYLAQAQDLYDLEARMRHLDGDEFSRRGRALR